MPNSSRCRASIERTLSKNQVRTGGRKRCGRFHASNLGRHTSIVCRSLNREGAAHVRRRHAIRRSSAAPGAAVRKRSASGDPRLTYAREPNAASLNRTARRPEYGARPSDAAIQHPGLTARHRPGASISQPYEIIIVIRITIRNKHYICTVNKHQKQRSHGLSDK